MVKTFGQHFLLKLWLLQGVSVKAGPWDGHFVALMSHLQAQTAVFVLAFLC